MSRINWYSLKKKDTGQIFTVGSTLIGGRDGVVYNLYDQRGVLYKVPEEEIKKDYERAELDFSQYADKFLSFAKIDNDFRNCFYKLARRLDPDYYKVGVTVFFQEPEFSLYRPNHPIMYGAEYPYIITEISRDVDRLGLYWIYLSRGVDVDKLIEDEQKKTPLTKRQNTLNYRLDFRVPLYMDTFEVGDAFECLKRYDKPY